MTGKKVLALGGALVAAVATMAASATAAGGTKVTVRVEGKTKTLLAPTTVRTQSGWITAGGVPTGKCSAASGQGALDVATHHKWSGTFSSSLGSYFIKTILGETDNGPKLYWSIYVNHRSATTGACGIKLRAGDQLLFAAAPYPAYATAVNGPRSATVDLPFQVKVVWFPTKGASKPVAGARISGPGISAALTNGKGITQVTASRAGMVTLTVATRKGYIRPAPFVVHVS